MASTNSGSAWSIADDRDRLAQMQAYRRGPARHVWVEIPDGRRVPGLAWSWRNDATEALTTYLAWVETYGADGAWTQFTGWVATDLLTPVEHR